MQDGRVLTAMKKTPPDSDDSEMSPGAARPANDEVDRGLVIDDDCSSEEVELLGEYRSVEDYCRAQLEELLVPGAHWLLDCLDMDRVVRRFEGDGRYRYFVRRGRVFRAG
jgi:hypothetical protein